LFAVVIEPEVDLDFALFLDLGFSLLVAHVSDGEKPDQISVAFCETSASLDQPSHPLEDFLLRWRQVSRIPGPTRHDVYARVDVLRLRALKFVLV
jgi:hypothetical protein